ncbi:MAG: ABC transporter permease [Lautropia sp.]
MTTLQPHQPVQRAAWSESAKAPGRNSATRRRAISPAVQVNAVRLAVIVLFFGLWQASASNNWVSHLLAPPPWDVVMSLKRGLIDGLWWGDIGITVLETVLGFGIGFTVAVLVGTVFAFVPLLRRALYPFVIAFQCFPKVAVAPVLIVVLGYGIGPKVATAALLAFFPILVATIAGLTEINPDEHNLMRAIRASWVYELRYLRIPNAMSYVFPAMDVAIVFALLAAIVAEFLGANQGLGYIVQHRAAYGDTATIYGALVVMAVIGLLFKGVLTLLKHYLPRSIVPR